MNLWKLRTNKNGTKRPLAYMHNNSTSSTVLNYINRYTYMSMTPCMVPDLAQFLKLEVISDHPW